MSRIALCHLDVTTIVLCLLFVSFLLGKVLVAAAAAAFSSGQQEEMMEESDKDKC